MRRYTQHRRFMMLLEIRSLIDRILTEDDLNTDVWIGRIKAEVTEAGVTLEEYDLYREKLEEVTEAVALFDLGYRLIFAFPGWINGCEMDAELDNRCKLYRTVKGRKTYTRIFERSDDALRDTLEQILRSHKIPMRDAWMSLEPDMFRIQGALEILSEEERAKIAFDALSDAWSSYRILESP